MLVCTCLSVLPLEEARTLRCTLLSLSWNFLVPREYYIWRLCGRMFALLRVFPCPVTSAVNSDVIGIFVFKLCSRFGKKDRQTASFAALFHCSCHCSSPFLLISLATNVNGILSNTMFIFSSSWAASFASLSATSLPSIPVCAFNHLYTAKEISHYGQPGRAGSICCGLVAQYIVQPTSPQLS